LTEKPRNKSGALFISLRLKVVLAILLVLLVGLFATMKLAMDSITDQIYSNTERESRSLAGIVHDTISHSMLQGDREEVKDAIASLGQNEKVKGVWLTNHEGKVVESTFPEHLGINLSGSGTLSTRKESLGFMSDRGVLSSFNGPVFLQTIRFDNLSECRPCHMGEGTVLGWLTVELSVEDELRDRAAIKNRLIFIAVILGLAMAGTAIFAITRLVTRPIENLAATVKEAESNPEVRAVSSRNDEIRLLTDRFNSLMERLGESGEELKRLHTSELGMFSKMVDETSLDLEDKIQKLSALSVISRNMTGIRKLDDLLKMVLNTAFNELDGGSGSIMLYQEGVEELFIHCGIGLSPEAHRKSRFKLGEGIAGWAALHKKTVMADSALDDDRYTPGRGIRHDIPLLCVPFIGSKGNVLGVINIERPGTARPFSQADMEYLTALSGQASVAIENVRLIEDLQKSYYDTISALAMTVEAKDPYTLGHSKRVTQYAMAIADEMGLSADEIRIIQYGSTLHDIGKIGVREAVLNKQGKLTDDEYTEIMDHAVIGENIVRGVDFLQDTRAIIRNHQEYYDGTGYPDKLKGDGIPLKVAIVTVADNYDALTTDRPYRKAYSSREAIDMIKSGSGIRFNPVVVDAFLRIFEE
jgi:putative nucleotidyltransferase with HDIG domain